MEALLAPGVAEVTGHSVEEVRCAHPTPLQRAVHGTTVLHKMLIATTGPQQTEGTPKLRS